MLFLYSKTVKVRKQTLLEHAPFQFDEVCCKFWNTMGVREVVLIDVLVAFNLLYKWLFCYVNSFLLLYYIYT